MARAGTWREAPTATRCHSANGDARADNHHVTLPTDLLAAVSADGGGRIALVIGAGCSFEDPTGLPLSRALSEEAHRRLVADHKLDHGECDDPSDLSKLADVVYAKTGSQQELVARFPTARFENATPNDGYLLAAALLREHAIRDVLTLNFDLAARHALASVGSGDEVGVITAPQDMGSALIVNLIHLHRDVHADADDWVLRTDQIEVAWKNGWEELVTLRVLTTPVVVFAGLGTAAAVLVDTTRRIRTAIGDQPVFHVDPEPFGTSAFTVALDIPETRYVQSGWCDFMRKLADRLVIEQLVQLRAAARDIEGQRGLPPQNHDPLFDAFARLGLLELGQLRAQWLLRSGAYFPALLADPLLLGDLVQGASVLAAELGVVFVPGADGCLQMRIGDRVVGVLIPASGGGTRDWAQFEADALARPWIRKRTLLDRTIVLAAGVTGTRAEIAAPEDLVGDPQLESTSVASAPAGPIFIDANELRADAAAALGRIK